MRRWGVVAALALAACGPPQMPFSEKQLAATSPFDLGPESIDVREYPEEQQANYLVFKERCSRCHTLARPVNFPAHDRKVWQAYVAKMHKRSGKVLLSPLMEKQIVDFLVFDGERRKTKPEFRRELQELQEIFARVERARAEGKAPKTEAGGKP